MSRSQRVGAVALGFFSAAVLVGFGPSHAGGQRDGKAKAEEWKAVPREDIRVSIFGQGNVPLKKEEWTENDEKEYRNMIAVARKVGPSNIFLVYGNSFSAAAAETGAAIGVFGGRQADTLPALQKDQKPFDVWVVVHLGVSSSDRWTIKAVERAGPRIRVSYADHGSVLGITEPYLMWARLGQLDPGKYTLELFKVNDEEVKLTRIVRIEK